jgi:D-alanine-D-alanine ligase-like ATP-grasp enzyme
METVVENLLRQPEYQDIKKIVATTGAIYLYSDKYLDPGAAQWQVQWEEVERHNNP